jgi:hypothetical protein
MSQCHWMHGGACLGPPTPCHPQTGVAVAACSKFPGVLQAAENSDGHETATSMTSFKISFQWCVLVHVGPRHDKSKPPEPYTHVHSMCCALYTPSLDAWLALTRGC